MRNRILGLRTEQNAVKISFLEFKVFGARFQNLKTVFGARFQNSNLLSELDFYKKGIEIVKIDAKFRFRSSKIANFSSHRKFLRH